jgi:hypothetical protein
MERRPGCLQGLLKMLALNTVFDWLQRKFGFGRGCSCTGMGCGLIMLVVVLVPACSIVTGTDWFRLGW